MLLILLLRHFLVLGFCFEFLNLIVGKGGRRGGGIENERKSRESVSVGFASYKFQW